MSKQLRPTKAADVEDVNDLKYPLIAMIKYDGIFSLVVDNVLLGRSLKPIKNKQITNELSKPEYNYMIGELCYGKQLNVQNLCRTTTSHINSHDKEWVDGYTWMLFDYIHPDVIDKPYQERLQALTAALVASDNTNVLVAPYNTVYEPTEASKQYADNLDDGFEGLILRCPNGKYKHGRSTLKEQIFMRMKPSDMNEAVVIGVMEAMENNNVAIINELGYTERSSHQCNKIGKGMVGSFICIDLKSGNEIRVGAGKLTHNERIEYFNNPPLGMISKYMSMATGVKDLPRHPRHYEWRDVVDIDDELLVKYEEIVKNHCGEYAEFEVCPEEVL